MRTHSIALPFVGVLLCLPLAGQEAQGDKVQFSVAHIVVLHSPVPTSFRRIESVCKGAEMQRSAVQALGVAGTDVVAGAQLNSSFKSIDERDKSERKEETSLEFLFYVTGKLAAPLPTGGDEKVFAAVLRDLEQRLKARLYDEPMARDQRRLAELEDLAKKLEEEHLQLRHRFLVLSDTEAANSAGTIADLDKKRLDVELDLRTEEAAQDRLQRMTMETQKRHEAVSTLAGDLGRQLQKIREQINTLRNVRAGNPEASVKQLEELNSKADDVMRASNVATVETARCASQLETIAEEARKATLSIHRLSARLQVLQSMIDQQRKLAATAQAASFERESMQSRAEETKARLTSVRQRAEEIRARLDAVEPVRLEVWK